MDLGHFKTFLLLLEIVFFLAAFFALLQQLFQLFLPVQGSAKAKALHACGNIGIVLVVVGLLQAERPLVVFVLGLHGTLPLFLQLKNKSVTSPFRQPSPITSNETKLQNKLGEASSKLLRKISTPNIMLLKTAHVMCKRTPTLHTIGLTSCSKVF